MHPTGECFKHVQRKMFHSAHQPCMAQERACVAVGRRQQVALARPLDPASQAVRLP